MKDWIYLFIAFILGFFVKLLLGTVCQSQLVEGNETECNVSVNSDGMPSFIKKSLDDYLNSEETKKDLNENSDMCNMLNDMTFRGYDNYFVEDICSGIKNQKAKSLPSFCNLSRDELLNKVNQEKADKESAAAADNKCETAFNSKCNGARKSGKGNCFNCANIFQTNNSGCNNLKIDEFCSP